MSKIAKLGAAVAVAPMNVAPFASSLVAAGVVAIARENASDVDAREALLDRAFGPGRQLKTSARMRVGRLPAMGLALVARDIGTDRVVGTVRLWTVALGGGVDGDGRDCLMLGPLGVDPGVQGAGIGSKLMRFAVAEAAFRGHAAIILVGDPDYYARVGFDAARVADLRLPGPVEQRRFLGLELQAGALAGASGLVRPTGPIAVPLHFT